MKRIEGSVWKMRDEEEMVEAGERGNGGSEDRKLLLF